MWFPALIQAVLGIRKFQKWINRSWAQHINLCHTPQDARSLPPLQTAMKGSLNPFQDVQIIWLPSRLEQRNETHSEMKQIIHGWFLLSWNKTQIRNKATVCSYWKRTGLNHSLITELSAKNPQALLHPFFLNYKGVRSTLLEGL